MKELDSKPNTLNFKLKKKLADIEKTNLSCSVVFTEIIFSNEIRDTYNH